MQSLLRNYDFKNSMYYLSRITVSSVNVIIVRCVRVCEYVCVREGRRERMMDMRWPTLPRDKIYTIMCEMILCVFGGGELEGRE